MNRRGFLGGLAAGAIWGQAPPTPSPASPPPNVPLPLPAKAKITCAVMLEMLPGSFEQQVKAAAFAGVQAVTLSGEYAQWNQADLHRARRFLDSFGIGVELVFAPRLANAMGAKFVKGPPSGDAIGLLDSPDLVKAADDDKVRLLFDARPPDSVARLRESLDLTAMVFLGNSRAQTELYTLLSKGYSHSVTLVYKPEGDIVASLKKATDQFRAGVRATVERPLV